MDEELEPVTVPEDNDEGSTSQHNSSNDNDNDNDGSEEEEEECRVCRGPAEEGRPLFSPCKCSGSIGLTHQDCLTSWLAVTRGEGRCELCKVKFHFAPQYAENAPDRLSVPEVLMGLTRRALARWLPFMLRLVFCLSLWLFIAPLLTSYLYLIWMNRSLSGIMERWKLQLLPADTVSGAVLAAVVLISFLSLMSFADFLRVEWQQQQNNQQRNDPLDGDGGERRRFRREVADPADEDRRRQQEVDNGLVIRFNAERAQRLEQTANRNNDQEEGGVAWERGRDNMGEPQRAEAENEGQQHAAEVQIPNPHEVVVPEIDAPADRPLGNIPNDRNRNDNNDDDNAAENRGDDNNNNNDNNEAPPPPPRVVLPPRNRPERPFDANMNLDPLMQDDPADMEINVALDELLGLRGPISSLLRNLLWLLVFNTVYLGFFAFIPRTIGSAVYSNIFNTTVFENTANSLPLVNAKNENMIFLRKTITDINEESENLNTIFRLRDFAAVNLGYLFCATLVIMARFGWILSQKFLVRNSRGIATAAAGGRDADAVRAGAREAAQRLDDAVGDRDAHPHMADGMDHIGVTVGEAIGLILDATVAVVKVGILLFLKMFLLPVLLGIWLDAASMDLFGSNAQERILGAGRDLFSFVLLHWVVGITFMLLVTVSVLQLREVAHPDLLSHLIRPQEPQPDLLGNLMHDSVVTQAKRMVLSLIIYSMLLMLHVAVPVKLLLASGVVEYLPFLKLKFWHVVMPQLQVPIELLVFHLSMLALLEKYKNSIGELQHHWLAYVTSKLGLIDYILPKTVDGFVLAGKIPVAKSGDGTSINPALYDIAENDGDKEALLVSNMARVPPAEPRREEVGDTRDDGMRMMNMSQAYISLPARSHNTGNGTVLLPTKIGRFRLKSSETLNDDFAIEVWEEKPGEPVPRPPEGWDDLGAGGADIQGRWAWGKEKQSAIEKGVAERLNFFGPHGHSGKDAVAIVARILLLLFFSWCATTLLLFFIVTTPVGVGRLLYWILRVPERYIHYPLAFAVGCLVVFPAVGLGTKAIMSSTSGTRLLYVVFRWIRTCRLPSTRKLGVLMTTSFFWFLFCPWVIGINYELCLVKTPAWFSGEEKVIDLESILLSWLVGTVLLNAWASLCSFSVFTKDFWVNVGNGMLDAPPNEGNARPDDRGAGNETGGNDNAGPGWQGKHGRLAKFFSVWKAVLFRWDYENVDPVVLLAECALPVSKNLGTLLLAPVLCCLGWFWFMQAVLGLEELSGHYRLFIYRLATASTLLIQLSITFRKQIQVWFGAIHKTARDDRYLIGEILLNHQPEVDS